MIEVDRPLGVHLDLGGPSLPAATTPLAPDPATPAQSSAAIASDRIYPGLRTRPSGRQREHFLPRYYARAKR